MCGKYLQIKKSNDDVQKNIEKDREREREKEKENFSDFDIIIKIY